MGTNTLTTRANGQVIDETSVNDFKTALDGDLVPRNTSGVPTAVAGSLGSSVYTWFKIFFGAAASGLSIEESAGSIVIKVAGVTVVTIGSTGVTRPSLAPIAKVLSLSSGNFSHTGDTNLTSVTNLSTTVVCDGVRDVHLLLQGDGSNNISGAYADTSAELLLALIKDGTILNDFTTRAAQASSLISYVDIAPAAGSHTYEIKCQLTDGSATAVVKYVKLLAMTI